MFDIIVIGAGVVGSLLARSLSSYKVKVLVLEKESDVGNVTSMANSAIVHSGYDPVPGTLKAILNVKGNKMFPTLCEELDVSFAQIGSLTIALYDEQMPLLASLMERSKENGVEVKLLNASEVREMEPNISKDVKGALFAPSCGIVNPFTLCVHAMENAVDNGVELHLSEEVIDITKNDSFHVVKTNKQSYEGKIVIDCAGIHGDDVHSFIEQPSFSIKGRKGEYYVLDHYQKGLVNHTIFPLPSEKGKGILVSPTTSGNYLVGPSSEFVLDKDDLSTDKPTLNEVKNQAVSMIPSIPFNQVIRTFSGVRPTPSTHDFVIGPSENDPLFIDVCGIESPGLASSPAIAEYVIENYISKIITLTKKSDYKSHTRKRVELSKLSIEERNAIIAKDPTYGEIICNCEKVSLGEILDEFRRSVPPTTIKAVKKRTRAGFGKCQGGFCQPLVIKALAKYLNMPMSEIKLDKDLSYIAHFLTKKEAK